MAKKNSNYILLSVLLGLLAIYGGLEIFGNNSGISEDIRQTLVELDPAKTDRLSLSTPGQDAVMRKNGTQWEGQLANGRWVPLDNSKVEGTLSMLLQIKPSRMASRKKEKWNGFKVDSTGLFIQAFEGEKQSLGLIIGKTGSSQRSNSQQGMYPQRPSFHTYVRLSDEDEVYVVNNFMSATIRSKLNDYRSTQLLSIDTDSLKKISFQHPGGRSFSLAQTNGVWRFDTGEEADSIWMANYLQKIRYISSRSFEDEADYAGKEHHMRISFSGNGSESLGTLYAYEGEDGEYLIKSDSNPNAFKDSALFRSIFIEKPEE